MPLSYPGYTSKGGGRLCSQQCDLHYVNHATKLKVDRILHL